jgi:hypothetical protein
MAKKRLDEIQAYYQCTPSSWSPTLPVGYPPLSVETSMMEEKAAQY